MSELDVDINQLTSRPSVRWLMEKLLPKILSWTTKVCGGSGISDYRAAKDSPIVTEADFASEYSRLKAKYGVQLVQVSFCWSHQEDPHNNRVI